MYQGERNKSILNTITSGAKVLTGTRTVITNQARNLNHNVKHVVDGVNSQLQTDPKKLELVPRDKIVTQAQTLIKEDTASMYTPPSQMGQGAPMMRNVVNPYNPKRKSESTVDLKARYAAPKDVYPTVRVSDPVMQQRVRKVRTYLYKGPNGLPVATKLEHQAKTPYVASTM